jgi:hypothetical protein
VVAARTVAAAAAAAVAAGVPQQASAAVLTAADPVDAAARMPFWALTPAAVAAVAGRVGRLTPVQLRALAVLPFLQCIQVVQLHVVAADCTPAAAVRAQPAVQLVRARRSLLQAALVPAVMPSRHFETLIDCFARRAGCSSSLWLVGTQRSAEKHVRERQQHCRSFNNCPLVMSIIHLCYIKAGQGRNHPLEGTARKHMYCCCCE